jgi:hypothetical protein
MLSEVTFIPTGFCAILIFDVNYFFVTDLDCVDSYGKTSAVDSKHVDISVFLLTEFSKAEMRQNI